VVDHAAELYPFDLMEIGGEFIEAYRIGEEYIHAKDILIAEVVNVAHLFREGLHDFPAGIVGVALGGDEDGGFEPFWLFIFDEMFGELLVDLMQCAFFLDDEQVAAVGGEMLQPAEAGHVGDHPRTAFELALVDGQVQVAQKQAAAGTDDAEVLSREGCVEGDHLDVIVNQTVQLVVVNKFVVQISLGDELALGYQRQDYLHDLQDPGKIAYVVEIDFYSTLSVSFILECLEAELLVVREERRLEGLIYDAIPNLLLQGIQSLRGLPVLFSVLHELY
jgi:hypothetical protein